MTQLSEHRKMVLSGASGTTSCHTNHSWVCVGGCHLGFDASKRPRFDIPDADSPTPSGVGPHKPLGNRCCTVSAIDSTIHDVDVLHATKHLLSASQLWVTHNMSCLQYFLMNFLVLLQSWDKLIVPARLLIEPLAVHSVRCHWPRVEAPEMQSLSGFVFGRQVNRSKSL